MHVQLSGLDSEIHVDARVDDGKAYATFTVARPSAAEDSLTLQAEHPQALVAALRKAADDLEAQASTTLCALLHREHFGPPWVCQRPSNHQGPCSPFADSTRAYVSTLEAS